MNRKPFAILLLAGAATIAAGGIASASIRDDAGVRQPEIARHQGEVEARAAEARGHAADPATPATPAIPAVPTVDPAVPAVPAVPADDHGQGAEPGDDHAKASTTVPVTTPEPTTPVTVDDHGHDTTPDHDATEDESHRGSNSHHDGVDDQAGQDDHATTTVTPAPVPTPTTVDDKGGHGADAPTTHDVNDVQSGKGGSGRR